MSQQKKKLTRANVSALDLLRHVDAHAPHHPVDDHTLLGGNVIGDIPDPDHHAAVVRSSRPVR